MNCLFCGAGVVPMVMDGEVTAWGCLNCRSERTGYGWVEGEPVTCYLRFVRADGDRRIWVPDGCLLVAGWEAE